MGSPPGPYQFPGQQYPGQPVQQYPGQPVQQYPGQPVQQYPGQPMQPMQPVRQRRSNFWGGCAFGACLVIVLEVAGLIGAGFLVQAAASRALNSLTSALSSPTASEPCAPQPCLAYQGLTLKVANLKRSAGPATPPSGTPDPAFHRVRMDLTLTAARGDHEVNGSGILLKDVTGHARGPAASPGCAALPSGALTASQSLGPTGVCFDVRGTASDALTLQWFPDQLSSFTPLELHLP